MYGWKSKVLSTLRYAAFFSAAPLILFFLNSGCGNPMQDFKVDYFPQISLVNAAPYYPEGEEPDVIPEPTRLNIDYESVLGWKSPDDGILRLPVNLGEDPVLTFRLRISTVHPLQPGDIHLRIYYNMVRLLDENSSSEYQYRHEDDKEPEPEIFRRRDLIFESSDVDVVGYSTYWVDHEIPLDIWKNSYGFLEFMADGKMADDSTVVIFWGEPTLTHSSARRNRHVLLIGVDTLRSDALSMYGGRENSTPNLEEWSSTGTVFTSAYSQAPWTIPSFASILTGKLPSEIYPTIFKFRFPSDATSVASMLLENNISTGGVVGNPNLGNSVSGFESGMESYWYEINADPYTAVRSAEAFLDRHVGRDWFLFLHFMDPHAPYTPPQKFAEEFIDPDYSGDIGLEFHDSDAWAALNAPPPDDDIRRARDLYDAEVKSLDEAVGYLFDYMQERGMLENTLVIFAADHGEEFYDHGRFEHGTSLYNEMIKLPLIIWGGKFDGGNIVNKPVANIDILPTILDFFDLDYAPGRYAMPLDVFPHLESPDIDNRIIFGEGNIKYRSHKKYALEYPYKLILDYYTSAVELYDVVNDPHELTDLSSQYPDIVENLRQEIIANNPLGQTMFAVSITGGHDEEPVNFSGTLTVEGGIAQITGSSMIGTDAYDQEGDTIHFNLSSIPDEVGNIKALIIIPNQSDPKITMSCRLDTMEPVGRFFPYGTSTSEDTGEAEFAISDLPWPATLPVDARENPVAFYVVGGMGTTSGQALEHPPLSEEEKEQLRAVGYIQ